MNETVNLNAKIVSIGAWGEHFSTWQNLMAILQCQTVDGEKQKSPKPEIIPANERRRAPLPVRLAVESSWQATQESGYKASDLKCVFVSSLGDTQLTDYMCKVLATENKQLSPTKFHNSVHNAAAGYWTISTNCMQAANSVAAYEESVPMTLIEALTQVVMEDQPVLISFYDAPVSQVLKSLLKNDYAFSVSMVLAPISSAIDGVKIQAEVLSEAVEWPDFNIKDIDLMSAYESNPTAKILALLKSVMLAESTSQTLAMPLSKQSSIKLTIG